MLIRDVSQNRNFSENKTSVTPTVRSIFFPSYEKAFSVFNDFVRSQSRSLITHTHVHKGNNLVRDIFDDQQLFPYVVFIKFSAYSLKKLTVAGLKYFNVSAFGEIPPYDRPANLDRITSPLSITVFAPPKTRAVTFY